MSIFNPSEIVKHIGWNKSQELFIPTTCYECPLMKDIPMKYSKCIGDGKEIDLPYEKCSNDCPIRDTINKTRFLLDLPDGDVLRRLYILKVLTSTVSGASDVIDDAIKLIARNKKKDVE